MPNAEIESIQPSWDQQKLESGVRSLGLLYGISGLEIVLRSGAGWSCAKTEHGLTVTIDPQQTIETNGVETAIPKTHRPEVSPEVTTLFITAHELGHANDFLDPTWRRSSQPKPSRDFFDCLVDDTVIDKRNRRVPLLDAHADEVYSHQIPSDLTGLPKHVQLLYGMRIGTVVKDPDLTMDKSVSDILNSLVQYQKGEQTFNILDVMTDPRTSLAERRLIADKFIWPHFDALLEEDKQEQGDDDQSESGDGASEGEFQDVYDAYEQAVHGHQQGDGESEQSQQAQPGAFGQPGSEGSLSVQIAEAIKQTSAEQQAKDAAKTSTPKVTEENVAQHEAQLSELAGTVAAEMQLSAGNAKSYVRSLDRWTPTIKEVANVFMKLAAPTNVIMSPRYATGAHTEGVRLHPRTMARVALQLIAGQDQAIWQPIVRKAHRQEITFGGLDVHLLVDVSGSMAGAKAKCAADTALCLIEGLQLARHNIARTAGKFHQPDVRTQIIAFGSGTVVLSPLSQQPTSQQKGKTYTNLLEADSSSTLVNGALELVKQASTLKPERDAIAIIVSDGRFKDHVRALATVASMPKSVYVAHLVIGGGAQTFISDKRESVGNPSVLPGKLHGILADYIRRSR